MQNSNDYLRQIDCLGFAGSVAKRNAGCQDPAHCLSGFLSKAGSFLPGFIFSLCTCKKPLRLAPAFASAATWTRLCSRSSRIGGWLHSRYGNLRILVPKGGGDSAVMLGISHLSFGRTFWEAVVRSFSVGCSERPLHDSYSYAMTCIATPSLCVGRPLRDSCSHAMVLGDLRRCKTVSYRIGHRATIYGVGAVVRRCAMVLGDLRCCKTPLIA